MAKSARALSDRADRLAAKCSGTFASIVMPHWTSRGWTSAAVVVVISEGWDAARFDGEFQERCQACFDQGHWLVFLLVGSPGTRVQQVPLSFGIPVMAQTDEYPTRPRRLIVFEDE